MNIINTREDLDALKGTPSYGEFVALLKGSMSHKQDSQAYPDDYNQPEYAGEVLEPIWIDVEDLATIERFGFTKDELLAL
jgi:hypothetical protein